MKWVSLSGICCTSVDWKECTRVPSVSNFFTLNCETSRSTFCMNALAEICPGTGLLAKYQPKKERPSNELKSRQPMSKSFLRLDFCMRKKIFFQGFRLAVSCLE